MQQQATELEVDGLSWAHSTRKNVSLKDSVAGSSCARLPRNFLLCQESRPAMSPYHLRANPSGCKPSSVQGKSIAFLATPEPVEEPLTVFADKVRFFPCRTPLARQAGDSRHELCAALVAERRSTVIREHQQMSERSPVFASVINYWMVRVDADKVHVAVVGGGQSITILSRESALQY
mgnify:CR=1 FL=1